MNTTGIESVYLNNSQKNYLDTKKMIEELMSEFNNSIEDASRKPMFIWLKRCMI